MKKWGVLFVLGVLIFLPVAVFAADSVGVSVQVPAWQEALMGLIMTAITALLGFATKAVITWENGLVTGKHAAWVNTAMGLAGAGVRMAEAKFGPNTDTGIKKREDAVNFIMANLKGVSQAQAQQFVDAAYADAFLVAAPLVSGPAPVATKP